MTARAEHWDDIHAHKREDEVSWFQPTPQVSLDLIQRCGFAESARLVDVGGGVSRLVDALLDRGFSDAMARAVAPGGYAIVGTFVLDGPERCSGLEIARYDFRSLAAAMGAAFELVEEVRHEHRTPAGKLQAFTFVRLRRA